MNKKNAIFTVAALALSINVLVSASSMIYPKENAIFESASAQTDALFDGLGVNPKLTVTNKTGKPLEYVRFKIGVVAKKVVGEKGDKTRKGSVKIFNIKNGATKSTFAKYAKNRIRSRYQGDPNKNKMLKLDGYEDLFGGIVELSKVELNKVNAIAKEKCSTVGDSEKHFKTFKGLCGLNHDWGRAKLDDNKLNSENPERKFEVYMENDKIMVKEIK
ncbi:MAG: hypothetical protein UR26_C0002G0171 [candidate division TM6 bacterium GW2011_GWF2_32_72]|nr:MAG: hypothetical protein UR26_C0002G0171 [candidate division TM6 bacterium GW2011_GWF2_32_72]